MIFSDPTRRREARGIGKRLRIAGLLALSWLFAGTASAATFTTLDGTPRDVSSYTGADHWLVVMIWISDCHVCNMEVESYAQLHDDHKDRGIRVLGLSMDGANRKAAAESFVETHAVPFPNLIGEPNEVASYFATLTGGRFMGTPSILVFDPDGTLAAAQAGAVPPEAIVRYVDGRRNATAVP